MTVEAAIGEFCPPEPKRVLCGSAQWSFEVRELNRTETTTLSTFQSSERTWTYGIEFGLVTVAVLEGKRTVLAKRAMVSVRDEESFVFMNKWDLPFTGMLPEEKLWFKACVQAQSYRAWRARRGRPVKR